MVINKVCKRIYLYLFIVFSQSVWAQTLITTTATTNLRIASYNIQVFPEYLDLITPPNHKKLRVLDIPQQIGPNFDVVFFNEIFDRSLRHLLIDNMREKYPYWIDVANNDLNLLSSGVMAFSRWPIVKVRSAKFNRCRKEECLASKGVLYIRIEKTGRIFNLFGMHTQSDDKDSDVRIREAQLTTLKHLINEQNIDKNEPIILAGDFNIDTFDTKLRRFENYPEPIAEHPFALWFLNAAELPHSGLTYSFDGLLNKMTALSKANRDFRQALDHIWVSSDHKTPTTAVEWYQEMKSTRPEMAAAPDTSDHFPVMAELEFQY